MSSSWYRRRVTLGSATVAVAALALAVGLAGRGTAVVPAAAQRTPDAAASAEATWSAPIGNAGFDYQIGATYDLPETVSVVSRDRGAEPAEDAYNICYVNAYQTQTEAADWWRANHPDLLLRDAEGELVVDANWDEYMLDHSTAEKRAALTEIVRNWIDECADKGFDAVEPDNLDSHTRSRGLLTESGAVDYAASLVSYAHSRGLAVAQKNDAGLGTADARKAGFDFAIAESCATYDECRLYTESYGDRVLVIEYTESGFDKACAEYGAELSVVLRDVDVTAPGSPSHVSRLC